MKYLFFVLILTLSNSGLGQTRSHELTLTLDTIISKSKEISYYTQSVHWDSLSNQIYDAAEGAETLEDLTPALEILLNGMRDHHGHFRRISDYSILARFTDVENKRIQDNRVYDEKIWKIVNDVESRFEYALLPNKIGYLKIVGVGPNLDGQQEAERIRNALFEFHKQDVSKWIVDLRYNGGGNINVMLSGIAPLLDNQMVLTIQDGKNEIIASAEIIDNNFWYRGSNVFPIPNRFEISNPKIAVLTSRWTTSSGEFVAVAFKGQDHTLFFGEATEGKTTENSWEIINNEIALVISTGVYCDRNGTVYHKNVTPDHEIEFVVELDKEKDNGIQSAIKWLNRE